MDDQFIETVSVMGKCKMLCGPMSMNCDYCCTGQVHISSYVNCAFLLLFRFFAEEHV